MKTLLTIAAIALLSSCASQGQFVETGICYTDPDTKKVVVVPATVYVKNGEIRSVIVE